MSRERIQYSAKLRATHEDVSGLTRRSFPSAISGTFLLLLLDAAGYAQTDRTADERALVSSPLPEKQRAPIQDDSIRPFHINVPEEQLVDLRQRLVATRWPDKETINAAFRSLRLFNNFRFRDGFDLNELSEIIVV